jgi:hypothetical protein
MSATKTKAASTIVVPHRCKLSKVCSTDRTRPILTHAYLKRRGDGWWLLATDSYIACAVRVSESATDAEEGWVPIGALRLMESGKPGEQISTTAWRVVANDGYVTFDVLPSVVETSVFPNFGAKGIDLWGEGDSKPKSIPAAGINPRLMARLGEGLGAHNYGCRFEFLGENKPIRVTPLSSPDADRVGLQMPIRLSV